MNKKDAIEIKQYMGNSIDKVVENLIKLRDLGQNAYYVFNGHKLYSCDVTLDSAYLEITGLNYADYNKEVEKIEKKYKKEKAIEIKQYMGNTIDKVVENLIKLRDLGQNVYYVFNDHKLYSCDVTLDSAYLEITGLNYADYNKEVEKIEKKYKKEKEAAIKNIPNWIEEGKKYIEKEKWDEWAERVNIRATAKYHGRDLNAAIEIFKGIDNKTIQSKADVEKTLENQGHSGASYSIVKSMVTHFDKDYKKLPEKVQENTSNKENKVKEKENLTR